MENKVLRVLVDFLVSDIEEIYGLDETQVSCYAAISRILGGDSVDGVGRILKVRMLVCHESEDAEVVQDKFSKAIGHIEDKTSNILAFDLKLSTVKRVASGIWEVDCGIKTVLEKSAVRKLVEIIISELSGSEKIALKISTIRESVVHC